MIRVAYFDYGGVLTPGGKNRISKEVPARHFGLDTDDIQVDDLDRQLHENHITITEYFERVSDRYGAGSQSMTKSDYERLADIFERNEEVYELGEQLREQGIVTGVLSNVTTINSRLLAEHGAYEGFHPVVLSCDVGARKPDVAIYQRAGQLAACNPEEILLIDDKERSLVPARELGWKTILATSPSQVVEDVNRLFVEEDN